MVSHISPPLPFPSILALIVFAYPLAPILISPFSPHSQAHMMSEIQGGGDATACADLASRMLLGPQVEESDPERPGVQVPLSFIGSIVRMLGALSSGCR